MADTLTLILDIAPALVREGDDALEAAVVFRKWGGSPDENDGAVATITTTGVTLQVKAPAPSAYTSLPEQFGGPFTFAIGYIVARTKSGEVVAAARSHRVVWMSGAFPTEAFGKALAQMPGMSAGEQKHTLSELGGLKAGLSLAFAGGGTRSLVGFSDASSDETVTLDPDRSLKWPPEVF